MKTLSPFFRIIPLVFLALTLTSCADVATSTIERRPLQDSVRQLNFLEDTTTVHFENLDHNDIILVRLNQSNLIVSSENTGGVQGHLFSAQDAEFPAPRVTESVFTMGHSVARAFNANPPPIREERLDFSRNASSRFVPPVVGDTRLFWVETFTYSESWVQRQATLRATGRHRNIWVMNENFSTTVGSGNMITAAQAQSLADTFDRIYPIATNILGFEFGGGPNSPFPGGMDGDPKIQILIYDIVDASGRIVAAGYFWAKDFFTQTELDLLGANIRTNMAEIFYLDASHINSDPDFMYSTLIHELQHMINFNMKFLRHGLPSPAWYNEMLSMMAEDLIAPLIGISPRNPDHVIQQRVPRFLRSYYATGVAEFAPMTSPLALASYANVYAFGAYLVRNFGGANLVRRILHNNTVGVASITQALGEITPGMTFERALARYGEALVFGGHSMPEGVLTFDRNVRSTVNGITYTAYAFNIWNMPRLGGGVGPYIFDLGQRGMRPRSVSLHSTPAWRNRSGNLSITLVRPTDPDVILYLMVR